MIKYGILIASKTTALHPVDGKSEDEITKEYEVLVKSKNNNLYNVNKIYTKQSIIQLMDELQNGMEP